MHYTEILPTRWPFVIITFVYVAKYLTGTFNGTLNVTGCGMIPHICDSVPDNRRPESETLFSYVLDR
ncbi:uncharacterized protein BO96DRAFT_74440 [Aspergillus niger CBS 101883]|uniref:uncharacterized protein n=1 Tax=Aspergillus lacticoffeatus (strain CBS 101883) TaxID=1450533 RepID=UPI000D7EE6B2|nr:uncharacterized protein BO96DRAFT_74440 [Aspergillus niger CBS 101883]PYH55327.1 hypothetical protein BO96DRAFT_74440 [Aspergillus niger CBS 101883]